MMFKTWGYIVRKMLSLHSCPQPTFPRLWPKHWHLRLTSNSVIIWKVCRLAASSLFPFLDFFISCSQSHVLESGTSSNLWFISLIDVEEKLDSSHYCRWNSATRRSSMDVHQYWVKHSPISCYNTSDVYNSAMCTPTQKDGWVQVINVIIYLLFIYIYRFICPSTEVFGTASIIVSHCIVFAPSYSKANEFIVGCHRSRSHVLKGPDILVRTLNFFCIAHGPQLATYKSSCLLFPHRRHHSCYYLVIEQTIPQ